MAKVPIKSSGVSIIKETFPIFREIIEDPILGKILPFIGEITGFSIFAISVYMHKIYFSIYPTK